LRLGSPAPHNFVFLEGIAINSCAGLRAMGRICAGWALSQTFYRREMWRGLVSTLEISSSALELPMPRHARPAGPALTAARRHSPTISSRRRNSAGRHQGEGAADAVATDLYFQTDDNRKSCRI
jgi:homoserine O-acetyltransferase